MKTLLASFLLAMLPIVTQIDTNVSISGNIDLRPGETAVLTASPGDSSYTYEWDTDGNWSNLENYYNFSISGNKLSITPKNNGVGLLHIICNVYDENGNYIGYDEVEILWI